MAAVLSFFITVLIVVPLSSYLIVRSVFSTNEVPVDPSQYLRPSDHYPQFLSPHKDQHPPVELPLHTSGRYIVDTNGTRVRLFSVNWYGASDGGFVPGGLDVRHRDGIAMTIKKLGFNSVRLPYADEMVYKNPTIDATLLSANPDLVGQSALQVYAAVVKAMTDVGLFVIINNHITQARWCCDANVCDGLWKNDHWGPFCRIRQTEETWIRNLETVMLPHISDPYVIGVDLRNEIRGITDRLLWNSWATAAEHAAARLHILQPEWLMIVEGVSSANDISGAARRPVKLSVPNKLVYSSHVYGWSGWGSLSPFWKRPYDSFAAEMQRKWGYLLEQDIAPVWVGELGAPDKPNEGDLHYWKNLMRYLGDIDADFAYWAINPRKWDKNEKESYSLVHDDWKTPVIDYRMYDMMSIALR